MSDKKKDDAIRAALKNAAKIKRLGVVAAVTGISETKLREIMRSEEPLSVMDRSALIIHLA